MIPQSDPKANYLSHQVAIDSAIAKVLSSGWYILGEEVRSFEGEFAERMGAAWCVGVGNGTDAIELALRALGVCDGDHVLTVSHTAVATASAISRIGAQPVFVDVEPDTYTMSPSSLEQALTTPIGRSAKAIVVVHLYGVPADMPSIAALAAKHGLPIVEDCAQAHGATLLGRPMGSWGEVACYSFYPTKNLGALGDGGGVTGHDADLERRIRKLREYGWQTRYVSDTLGFNSRLDEIQAAVLRAKLPHLTGENSLRRGIASRYSGELSDLGLQLPAVSSDAEVVFHQYVIQCNERESVQQALRREGVATLVHYPSAVHQQPAYLSPALRPVPLAHTEQLVPRILSLPMFPELSDDQVGHVIAAVKHCTASN